MNFEIIQKIGDLLAFVPFLIMVYYWIITYLPSRRFLGFNKDEEIDFIVTTSDLKKDEKGLKVLRATTGIGQIIGIAEAAKIIGKLYRKKAINIQLSGLLTQRPNKDLILLGGPAKNEISKKFIRIFKERNKDLKFEFDDISTTIRLDDIEIIRPDLDCDADGNIDFDYSIVIVSDNPFSSKKRRAIFCAGFTSYGTSGGATWLFDDLLLKNAKRLKILENLENNKKASFIAIIKVQIASKQVVGTECIKMIELKNKAKTLV